MRLKSQESSKLAEHLLAVLLLPPTELGGQQELEWKNSVMQKAGYIHVLNRFLHNDELLRDRGPGRTLHFSQDCGGVLGEEKKREMKRINLGVLVFTTFHFLSP